MAENAAQEIKVGDTFAELMWTDRRLWVITEVRGAKEFVAGWVETECKDVNAGTEYPVRDADGKFKTYMGEDAVFCFRRGNWYKKEVYMGWDRKGKFKPNDSKGWGRKVHLSFGMKTGYTDPNL